jgi:hypothetical protein
MRDHPLLSPMPRFLLIRITSVRADNLADYVSEVAATLNLFEHGFRLLQSAVNSTPATETVYAEAV